MNDSTWQDKVNKAQDITEPQEAVVNDEPEVAENNLQQELDRIKNQMLSIAAEYDNYRKRVAKEIEDTHKYAVTKFATDVVDVFENLYRAQASLTSASDESLKSVLDGIELTIKSMTDMLAKHQIKRIFANGEAFDPNVHEAISKIASAEHNDGIVVDTIRAGYTIGDRLLRSALVIVAQSN